MKSAPFQDHNGQSSAAGRGNAAGSNPLNVGRAVNVVGRKVDSTRILPPIYTHPNPIIPNLVQSANTGPAVRPTLASKAAKRQSLMEVDGIIGGPTTDQRVRQSKPSTTASPLVKKRPVASGTNRNSSPYLNNTGGKPIQAQSGVRPSGGVSRVNTPNYRTPTGAESRNQKNVVRNYQDRSSTAQGSTLSYAKVPHWSIPESDPHSPRENANRNIKTGIGISGVADDQDKDNIYKHRSVMTGNRDSRGRGNGMIDNTVNSRLVVTNKQIVNELTKKGNKDNISRTSPLVSKEPEGRIKQEIGRSVMDVSVPRSGITPPISQMKGEVNVQSPKNNLRPGSNSVKDNNKNLYVLPARSEIVPPNKSTGMNNPSSRRIIGSTLHNPRTTYNNEKSTNLIKSTVAEQAMGGENRRLVQTNPDLVKDPKFSSNRPNVTSTNRYPAVTKINNTRSADVSGYTSKGHPTMALSQRAAQQVPPVSRGIGNNTGSHKLNIGSKMDGIKGGHSEMPGHGKKTPGHRKNLSFRCRPDEVMRRKQSEQLTDWYMGAYCYESPDSFFRNLLTPPSANSRVSIKPNDRGTLNQMYGEHAINSRRLREVSSVIGAAMYS